MGVSAKVAARISTQLKKYQRVLEAARQRDIGEADTVTIITDLHLHPARAKRQDSKNCSRASSIMCSLDNIGGTKGRCGEVWISYKWRMEAGLAMYCRMQSSSVPSTRR